MADHKLFQYYERQDILPTFADFKSHEQLKGYDAQRRELFSDKLMLPPGLFRAQSRFTPLFNINRHHKFRLADNAFRRELCCAAARE